MCVWKSKLCRNCDELSFGWQHGGVTSLNYLSLVEDRQTLRLVEAKYFYGSSPSGCSISAGPGAGCLIKSGCMGENTLLELHVLTDGRWIWNVKRASQFIFFSNACHASSPLFKLQQFHICSTLSCFGRTFTGKEKKENGGYDSSPGGHLTLKHLIMNIWHLSQNGIGCFTGFESFGFKKKSIFYFFKLMWI